MVIADLDVVEQQEAPALLDPPPESAKRTFGEAHPAIAIRLLPVEDGGLAHHVTAALLTGRTVGAGSGASSGASGTWTIRHSNLRRGTHRGAQRVMK